MTLRCLNFVRVRWRCHQVVACRFRPQILEIRLDLAQFVLLKTYPSLYLLLVAQIQMNRSIELRLLRCWFFYVKFLSDKAVLDDLRYVFALRPINHSWTKLRHFVLLLSVLLSALRYDRRSSNVDFILMRCNWSLLQLRAFQDWMQRFVLFHNSIVSLGWIVLNWDVLISFVVTGLSSRQLLDLWWMF